MKIVKLLRFFTLVVLSGSVQAWAYKIDFMAGGYSLTAKTSRESGSVSNLGAYKFTYSVPVTNRLEFGLGYTLILSDIFTGDAAFGLDLEGSYFFLSPNTDLNIQGNNTTLRMSQIWSPFINLGFHQRQFQSVQTQYNGFSAAVGVERYLSGQFRIKGLIRYMFLNGANEATATIMDGLAGVSFQF